jgi:hypothetical protein
MLAFFMGLETEWALNEENIDRKAVIGSYMESLFASIKNPDRHPRKNQKKASSARRASPSGTATKKRGPSGRAARPAYSSKCSKN